MHMKKLLIIFIGCFVFSCQYKKQVELPVFQMQDLKINNIILDSVFLDKDYFSGVGFFSLGRDQIFFVDQVFSSVISYDPEGLYQGTYLGKGNGPDEQNNIHGFHPYALDNKHVVLDNFELVVFDENFVKVTSYPIEWDYSESYQDMVNSPKGSMLGLYELDWKSKGQNTSFIIDESGSQVLLPITMSHPTLNGYMSEEYYQSVAILGRYDLKKKMVMEGFGRRSDKYLEQKFVPNFDFSFFTKNKNEILVSFAIDPLIHVFGADGELVYKFGIEGVDIRESYPKTNTIEDALDNYKLDLEKAGFYHLIYLDEVNNLTFRTYFPEGAGKGYSRLQVYQDKTLIGDVRVPERFRILGKIGDSYFADGVVDEINDRLGIYKFKLPTE
jgi:hypothetical protein